MFTDKRILELSPVSTIPGPKYICNFGKFSGKTALDIYKDENYCKFVDEKIKKSGQGRLHPLCRGLPAV